MNIAVIGADTRLGRRIAKDAFHRRHCVTAVVTDPSLLDSVRYTVVTGCEGFDPAGFDAVIDARSAELTITRGGVVSTLVPPAELDPDGRRLGQYTLGESTEGYIGEEDFALAAVDEAEGTEARRVTPVSGRAPALPEDGTDRRRYVALPDKGIAGKVYHLLMDDYNEYVAHFIADDRLLLAKQGEPFASYACQCLHCDDQVWFVSFLRDKECVTLILDEAQSLVTAIYAFAAAKKPLLAQHRILFGAIKPFNGEVPFRRHGYTDEMAGTKITWHYSPYVNITHCYVNESYMRNSLAEMKPLPADAPAEAVFLDAKIESELIDLDPEDAAELLASTGQDESGLDQLARIGFDTLGLQTYLTAGPKESRAWTIGKGWTAPQAAGVIHTDFQKGFIKAEIISFDDLVETGSVAEARSKGKARMEGKDYVMQDGDVVEFRFNV